MPALIRRTGRRCAALVLATLAVVTVSAVPAFADAPHRGVSGCFAYSWQPGWWTTTTFWHNRCASRHRIEVVWDGQAYDPTTRLVGGDGKGSAWTTSAGVTGVYDLGRA